eukprot:10777674-Ditylum_brightwellii.AAC.1
MEADKDQFTPLPDKDGWEFYLPPLPNWKSLTQNTNPPPGGMLPNPTYQSKISNQKVGEKHVKVMVTFGEGSDKRYFVPLAGKRVKKGTEKCSQYVEGNGIKR